MKLADPMEPVMPDRRRERWVLLLLTAVQFAHTLDFMIMMPLGPQLMRAFAITPGKFGALVSAYTFSAGAAGLLATFVLDRFDRRRALLWVFAGFAVATLSCGLAPTYGMLFIARVLAGAFGGVTASLVLAMVGDLIPIERRGAAIGLVMSGFSVASIAGVPAGLWLAGHADWHRPFVTLAAISAGIFGVVVRLLPSVPPHPALGGIGAAIGRARDIAMHPNHLRAFALSIALALGGYIVFPYLSPSLVANCGYPERLLPLVYVCGGLAAVVGMNMAGRLSDRLGRLRVFRVAAALSILTVLLATHLPAWPLPLLLVATAGFMTMNAVRYVPAMAMITASVVPRQRAGFLSLNSALQQIAGGISVSLAAWIVDEDAAGHILHYGMLGWVSVVLVLATLVLAARLRVAGGPPEHERVFPGSEVVVD
jgi:predicted MFS family arabinose efflux permease